MSKPREFWISCVGDISDASDRFIVAGPWQLTDELKPIHVIEYSAYAELEGEVRALKHELKMKDGSLWAAKTIEIQNSHDKIARLEAEIERLNLYIIAGYQEGIKELERKLEIAKSALEYISMDYPKSYIHDSDYERAKKALEALK